LLVSAGVKNNQEMHLKELSVEPISDIKRVHNKIKNKIKSWGKESEL
jgi:hypothetical protein